MRKLLRYAAAPRNSGDIDLFVANLSDETSAKPRDS